jgi:rhodanese-related sulfurtransferase
MPHDVSAVLEYCVPEPGETATVMEDKLRFHTDSRDLSVDLKSGLPEIVVVDARSLDAYTVGHIPGAISFPHHEMTVETTARLNRSKVYVVYCDGIGCNASTKGACKLARLGFRAKELLGGLDWWRRDGHPVVASAETGSLLAAAIAAHDASVRRVDEPRAARRVARVTDGRLPPATAEATRLTKSPRAYSAAARFGVTSSGRPGWPVSRSPSSHISRARFFIAGRTEAILSVSRSAATPG